MAHIPSQQEFDIESLRLVAADADVRGVSLSAALIKMHALTIARAEPGARTTAFEIIRHLGDLYRGLPNRRSIEAVVRRRAALSLLPDREISGLVEALWNHMRSGAELR